MRRLLLMMLLVFGFIYGAQAQTITATAEPDRASRSDRDVHRFILRALQD